MSRAKTSYTGRDAQIYAEAYMHGLDDGEKVARRASAAEASALASLTAQLAEQVKATDSAKQFDLDRGFGMVAPSTGVKVVGAVQSFGAFESTRPQ